MKMPKWLKILIATLFGISMVGFAGLGWASWLLLHGRCGTWDCDWYLEWGTRVAITASYTMLGVFVVYFLYTAVFKRAEWLQGWQQRARLPIWFWVLYVGVFAGMFALNRYSSHHEEWRSIGSMLFGLTYFFLVVPMYYHQAPKKRWQYVMMVVFVLFGVWQLYNGWDSIGTSDLRYCLGQTYFQRVPVQSTGCEIVKAIPTPRYFTGRECPTADLFAGCESGYPYGFNSYNQRKAAGINTDKAPLPWTTEPRPTPQYTDGGTRHKGGTVECGPRDPSTGAVTCTPRNN
jgi:hypothetical protein